MGQYGKAIAVVVATVISAIVAALTGDDLISNTEWINVAIAGVGAVSVALVPNLNAGVARYAKAIIAALMAILTLLVNLIADGVTISEWLQLAVVALAALGVERVPGAPVHQAVDASIRRNGPGQMRPNAP